MVEAQKVEQRGQAVKRFRSLFDMHNIAFGSPENLGGVLLSLHENRHFAMDFWSLVNLLSSQETGAPSEEEMLETVVESATGGASAALPKDEQPGVHELRQMLGGVDTARPAELPDAIARPSDDLLQPLPPPAIGSIANDLSGGRNAQATRRSIGDALAKLEQTSRELREQLAELEGTAVQEDLPFVAANAVEARPAETPVVEPKPVETAMEQKQSSSTREVAEAAQPAQMPIPAVAPVVVEKIEAPRATPVETASSSAVAAPAAAVPSPAPVPVAPRPMPPAAPVETEVFARRPVRELSHRGLSLPDQDDDLSDDPSIVAPLSGYAAQQEGGSGVRYAIVAVVIAAVAAGGFYGSRTPAGHAMLASAGASVRSMYLKAKDALGQSKTSAPGETQPEQSAADTAPATPPPAALAPAPTSSEQAQAATTPAPEADTTASADSKSAQDSPSQKETAAAPEQPAKVAVKSPIAAHKPVVTPPPAHKAKVEPPVVKKHPDEAALAAAAAAKALERQHAEEAASASLERVPGAIMARNLLASRVPAYPEAARSQQIEGPVELQVVVTPSGAVKYAHAVSGNSHLRAAAEEAVSKWRYRPYIENGSAVEIVTTVRIDFRLPQ